MNRAIGALVTTVAGLILVVNFKASPKDAAGLGASVTADAGQVAAPVPSVSLDSRRGDEGGGEHGQPITAPTASPRSLPTVAPPTSGQVGAKFTGNDIQTPYGDVQVAITISGGKIVDVQALTLPSDRSRSAYISEVVAPMLRSEAIQASSARINVISGATYTSRAYSQSLASALAKANIG
jgi:uncharacterized protein with FMN-binding domain